MKSSCYQQEKEKEAIFLQICKIEYTEEGKGACKLLNFPAATPQPEFVCLIIAN